MASDSVARERTWLVRSLPDPLPAGTPIAEGYLPGDGEVGVRVRRAGDHHAATVLGRGPRSPAEIGWELTAAQFEALWPLTRCRRVEKVRHEVPLGPLTAEVHVFAGLLEGLALVEVEFDDEEAMDAFTAPDWFGQEVSGDPRYAGSSLARHGLPAGGRCPGPPRP